MKKIAVLLCVIHLLFIAGCGDDKAQEAEVDLDLTGLNSTMLPAAIDNVYNNARMFEGKVIKMTGKYFTDGIYDYVLFFDESACCSYGFEIMLGSEYRAPELETKVSVTGVFDKYVENGTTYYFLDVMEFSVV